MKHGPDKTAAPHRSNGLNCRVPKVTKTRTHSAVNETTGITGGSWIVPTYYATDANMNVIDTTPHPRFCCT